MPGKEPTATGPNGEKAVFRNGEWVILAADAPRALPGRPTPEAAAKDREIRQGLRTGVGAFLANVLSLPHAAGELLAAGAAIPQTVGGAAVAAARGQPMNIGERFGAARREQESSFPASLLLKAPDPTTQDVLAVPGALSRSFSNINANAQRARTLMRDPNAEVEPLRAPQLSETYPEARAEEQRRSDESPIATGAGQAAGDVATLLGLRPGERMARLLKLRKTNPRAEIEIDGKGALDAAARTFMRGTGRSAEAGFEGAVIGALGDGDPVKTAAWTAGIQAGNSAALTAKNTFLRNPIKSFGALWLGHQMWKAIAPGPQQAFESSDAAIKELVGAYGLGTVAALAGGSRGIGSGTIRRVTDALSTASRGTIASVIAQLQEAESEGQDQYAQVLERMSIDPNHFGSEARIRLERAARSEKPRALLDEIDALMKGNRFRALLDDQAPE